MRGPITMAVLGLAATAAAAADPAGTITVAGSATVYVKPDVARVHYTVRALEPAVDAAKHAASKQVSAVDDAIRALKLSHLSTSAGALTYTRSSPAAARRAAGWGGGVVPPGFPGAGPNAGGPPPPSAYYAAQVSLTTTVREKDPERLRTAVNSVLKIVTEAGGATGAADGIDPDAPAFVSARAAATDGPRVEWLLDDDSAARRQALRSATDRAKANATTLSRELGWESFKILSLVDGSPAGRDAVESATGPRTPAGEVAVSARVTLTCSR